jgi:DNA integrity scanning protein DisA with diadenylate cyclase activity
VVALKQTINTITKSRNKRKVGSIFVFSNGNNNNNNNGLNHYNNSRKVDSRLDVEIADEVVPVDSLISSYGGGIDWKK